MNDSIARNSDFFLSPFGALVNGAAHTFIFELMANHSGENLDGIMDPVTLASFFLASQSVMTAVKKTTGTMTMMSITTGTIAGIMIAIADLKLNATIVPA